MAIGPADNGLSLGLDQGLLLGNETILPADFVPTSKEPIIIPTVHFVAWRRFLKMKPYSVIIVLAIRRGNARPFMVKLLKQCTRHGIYDLHRDAANRFCYSASLAGDNGKYRSICGFKLHKD
jgi:hypothetical protein